jgi:RND family efflux transporter MFP subunit
MAKQDKSRDAERPDLSALRMDRGVDTYRRGHWGWYAAGVVLLLAVAAIIHFAPLPWLTPKVETVTVQRVSPAQASTVLTATGYTYARKRAAVGAKIIGRIVSLHVEEGDRVGEGDLIAVLDSDSLQAVVNQARASLAEARARLKDARREKGRQEHLLKEGVASQAHYDQAATALEVAEAVVRTAQARLNTVEAELAYTRISAPLKGVVIERNAEVGEMVAPGGFTSQQSTGALVRIADLESLEVEADINESYIARLAIGQPATIQVDAVPGQMYEGHLRQIVPTADRQKAVVEVKVAIDTLDERLVPDMSCTVTFLEEKSGEEDVESLPVVMIPAAAVQRDEGKTYVFRLAGERLERLAVSLGAEQGDLVVVASGLLGGETIVRGGVEDLEDGMKVRPLRR